MQSAEDGFVLKGFPEETLNQIRSEHSLWEETSLSVVSTPPLASFSGDRAVKTKWCLLENTECLNQMKSSLQNLHWITFEKGEILWDRTDGDFTCLTQYVRKIFSECKELHVCNHNDVHDFVHCRRESVFLHANAGVGKSTFLMKLAEAIKNEDDAHWVVLVQASEGKTMEKLSERVDLRDIIRVLHLSASRHDALHSDSATRFLTDCIQNSGKITVLVDGVDEVCPAHKVKVFRFLELLQRALERSGGRLWVAARSVLEEDLARTLRCATPLSLRPFSPEDQQRYLLSLWGEHVEGVNRMELEGLVWALVNAVREATKAGDSSLCDVPLYTRMLADAYTMDEVHQLLQNYYMIQLSRLSLYNRFIRKTLSRVWIKRGISESDQINCDLNFYETLRKHSEYAALQCFYNREMIGEHYSSVMETANKLQMDDEREKVANTGIITQVVDGKPKFLHHTLAEYLAALWLKDKYTSLPELTLALYKGQFGEVRYFLDALLAEGHPLQEAALSGRQEAVEEALRREGQHVDAEDAGGRRALHIAAIYGYEPVVRVLVEYGADVHVRDRVVGWTPLVYIDALCSALVSQKVVGDFEQLAVAEQLLRARADPSDFSSKLRDSKCLLLALQRDYSDIVRSFVNNCDSISQNEIFFYLQSAVVSGSVNIVATILDTGFNIENPREGNWEEKSLLHEAVDKGFAHICGLLLQHGMSVNQEKLHGDTPLHLAAAKGDEGICRLLLERGAGVNLTNSSGEEALYKAAFHGHESICRLLLNNGARVTQANIFDETLLHTLPQRSSESVYRLIIERQADVNATLKNGIVPLHMAAFWGRASFCRLLLDNGASVDSVDDVGSTAMFWATRGCALRVCELLLERGADVNARNTYDYTPLFNAVFTISMLPTGPRNAETVTEGTHASRELRTSCERICRLLLDEGAHVNAALSNGMTALHVAASAGAGAVCRLLLDRGALPEARTSGGVTPLRIAQDGNHEDVCRLLQRAVRFGQQAHASEDDSEG